jgi:biotin carboxylase
MRRLLMISAGWEQAPLVQAAKCAGLYVIATGVTAEAEGLQYADEAHVLNPLDLSAVVALARTSAIDAVVADQCDYSLFAAALVAEVVGVPGPGLLPAQRTTNKKLMRLAWEAAGIRQPEFGTFRTVNEGLDIAERLGFPLIAKPVDNRGNFGVSQILDAPQLRPALAEALAHAHSREGILERFIEGTMVTADGFAFGDAGHRTLAIASKRMLGGTRRVAMEIRYPAELPADSVSRICVLHDRAVAALGVRYGATHGEYLVDAAGQVWPVEVANRGGGVFTSSAIVPAVSGFDLNEALLRQALGEHVEPPASIDRRAAILRFFALRPGRLTGIEGLANGTSVPGVLALRFMVGLGHSVKTIETDAGRHGFVIAAANTLGEADDRAARALVQVRVKYDESQWIPISSQK